MLALVRAREKRKKNERKNNKFCIVDECPMCGRLGHVKEYIRIFRRKTGNIIKFEFCVNHASEGQTKDLGNSANRNDFCRTGIYRDPFPDEILTRYAARPRGPPDWIKIKKRLVPITLRQTTLLS